MLTQLRCLFLLYVAALVRPNPAPGKIPKVYNALITSNQNLEPSKVYPVFQPVIHDAVFGFPLQSPLFYSRESPIGSTFLPSSAFFPKSVEAEPSLRLPSPSSEASTGEVAATTEQPAPAAPASTPKTDSQSSKKTTVVPSTQSPIPRNEFELTPQILPISQTFNSIPNIGHFTYSYPSIRIYDPFGVYTYARFSSLYHPMTNVVGQYDAPQYVKQKVPLAEVLSVSHPTSTLPSDLNVLNYSPKNTEIANVPPPSLPQGGLKVGGKSEKK